MVTRLVVGMMKYLMRVQRVWSRVTGSRGLTWNELRCQRASPWGRMGTWRWVNPERVKVVGLGSRIGFELRAHSMERYNERDLPSSFKTIPCLFHFWFYQARGVLGFSRCSTCVQWADLDHRESNRTLLASTVTAFYFHVSLKWNFLWNGTRRSFIFVYWHLMARYLHQWASVPCAYFSRLEKQRPLSFHASTCLFFKKCWIWLRIIYMNRSK